MINFWSYKDEYNKYRPQFNKFFDQTLKSGLIFFGPNLKNFEDGISPGQACVFYGEDNFGLKVLGGGWII